ncbi:MAG: adenylosuccinate lyase [Sulfolobales archaeon]|nr:adenylosuccinate lyase [Sulfolobales archaeon]
MSESSSVCPLDWRYGSEEMRKLFRVDNIVRKYVEVEIAIMVGLEGAGLAPSGCAEVLRKCSESVTADEVYSREAVLGHDIAALAYALGEKCGECGKYVHLGATSYDVVDTVWALIVREALDLVEKKLKTAIESLSKLAVEHRDTLMAGRTHGQHALPITAGFKFANYVYELSRSYERLCELGKRVVKSKISGAVGTMAGWLGRGLVVQKVASEYLGLEPHAITTQVAPRDGFAELALDLAILASQLDRFALEIRELSRTEIGEMYESAARVGSSTMPHKRNPVTAERISGLAKIVRSLSVATLENIPLMHERDLTNSSSERLIVPHVFLVVDQMLEDTLRLLRVLAVDREAMRRNVEISREEMLTEAIVVRLTLKGLPRHEAHRLMVELARSKKPDTSLSDLVLKHEILSKYLTPKEVSETLDPVKYLGNYSELIDRALEYAENVLRCQTH